MAARQYTLDEIWNLVVRYRWLILIPVAIGLAAAPLLGRFAPLRYRSQAVILVVPPQVPDKYVTQTVTTDSVAERLPSITAQILSRSRLERIILDMDLYKAERSRQVMEDVVERMRLRDIQTVPLGKDVDSFRVTFVSDTAATAQKVTEQLASLYIDQNAEERRTQAASTTELIAVAIETTKQRLSEQEKKLEAYSRAHPGQLPTQLQGNLHAIQSLSMQLQQLSESMNRAVENRMRVEKDLSALDEVPLPRVGATPSAPESLTTAERLDAARAQRALLLQRYTPDHPAVETVDRTIAELTERLENEAPLSARTSAREKQVSPAEAEQQRRRLNLKSELQVIDHSLNQYRAVETKLKRQIADYQNKVDVLPTREQELQELTREYNTLNASYNDLLMKRENASLAANMERRAIGERFELLDAASRPEKPYNQMQRVGVMGSGAAAALVLALLVIGVREYRDSSFRSKEEVLSALSLPVLASIPIMSSVHEREAATRRKWALDVAGSAVIIASVAFVVVWQLYS